jgi:hypothetical protein
MDPAGQQRAWHIAALGAFDAKQALSDIASRAGSSGFDSTSNLQIAAWDGSLRLLTDELAELIRLRPGAAKWSMLFEYEIPRRQRRIDIVLLADGAVIPIELKHGTAQFDRAAVWQAEDYALELRDFHEPSRDRPILPVLWATGSDAEARMIDGVALRVCCVGRTGLAAAICQQITSVADAAPAPMTAEAWDKGAYRPTPTIIEATQRLFAHHTVADISHSYADNLTETVSAIERAIQHARETQSRVICFVTGVPGAGKTLTGLAAAHAAQRATGAGEATAAYLSGNGPLVRVLREALARDSASRGGTKARAKQRAQTLVQNVHEFINEYAIKSPNAAPLEHVVVFDEAQRAWSAEKLTKRHPSLSRSEAALMLSIMERAHDWAVVVALVGGGQEIHTGEAGLEEWGRAVTASAVPWHVVVSPEALRGGSSVGSHRLFVQRQVERNVQEEPSLHLDVSVRSPRAKDLADWVNAVLDLQPEDAARSLSQIDGFRMGITRDLEAMRSWLRDAARGESRSGIIASSGNLRLRTYGLEVSPEFLNSCSLEHWFLGPRSDVRASSALEIAMTEFKVQGLELGYCGVCWGDDLTINSKQAWDSRRFKGTKWLAVRNEIDCQYLLNKYRVLLTRAREGMVIFVPRGDSSDPTREPARLDRTANYLRQCGLVEV